MNKIEEKILHFLGSRVIMNGNHMTAINYGLGDLFENIRASHEEIKTALKHLNALGYVVLKSNNQVVYLSGKGYDYYKEER